MSKLGVVEDTLFVPMLAESMPASTARRSCTIPRRWN